MIIDLTDLKVGDIVFHRMGHSGVVTNVLPLPYFISNRAITIDDSFSIYANGKVALSDYFPTFFHSLEELYEYCK